MAIHMARVQVSRRRRGEARLFHRRVYNSAGAQIKRDFVVGARRRRNYGGQRGGGGIAAGGGPDSGLRGDGRFQEVFAAAGGVAGPGRRGEPSWSFNLLVAGGEVHLRIGPGTFATRLRSLLPVSLNRIIF